MLEFFGSSWRLLHFCLRRLGAAEAVEGAGCGRSADSLSLGHNGIKLITSQCDRV